MNETDDDDNGNTNGSGAASALAKRLPPDKEARVPTKGSQAPCLTRQPRDTLNPTTANDRQFVVNSFTTPNACPPLAVMIYINSLTPASQPQPWWEYIDNPDDRELARELQQNEAHQFANPTNYSLDINDYTKQKLLTLLQPQYPHANLLRHYNISITPSTTPCCCQQRRWQPKMIDLMNFGSVEPRRGS